MIDYPLGVFLIAAPWISIVAGLAVLVMSALTNYEFGVKRVLPMALHNATEVIVGIFFVIAPWVVGLSDAGMNAWLPFVLMGLAAIAAGALTRN